MVVSILTYTPFPELPTAVGSDLHPLSGVTSVVNQGILGIDNAGHVRC
jgi:hypothetical protein